MLRHSRICSIEYINSLLNHSLLADMPSSSNSDHDGRYPLRDEWGQNGFPNRTDSSISWSDSTPDRTLIIAPTNGSFDYFIDGVKYTKSSSETIQITDTEGLWIFYYNGSTLTSQHNPTDAQIETIILSTAWVAFVYWDAANNVGTLFEERHGLSMSPSTHRELHFTAGTTFFDGLALGDFVISDGADNEDAQFSIATGQIFDEDIKHVLNTINKTTGVDIWYRSNSNWRKDTQTGFKVLTQDGTSGTRLSYDNAGTRTEVTDNKFVLYHIFAWNATDLNPITIMGQAEYTTAKLARAGATTEINSLLLGTLPSKEMKAIATVIFQTKDTYANDVNARVVQTDEGDDYVDWRLADISPSAAAQDHGSLAGLSDDDHVQYIKDSEFTQDSGVLVGTGTSTFQEETGATLRTSLGLGLEDNPQFNTLIILGDPEDSAFICLQNEGTGNAKIEISGSDALQIRNTVLDADIVLATIDAGGVNSITFDASANLFNLGDTALTTTGLIKARQAGFGDSITPAATATVKIGDETAGDSDDAVVLDVGLRKNAANFSGMTFDVIGSAGAIVGGEAAFWKIGYDANPAAPFQTTNLSGLHMVVRGAGIVGNNTEITQGTHNWNAIKLTAEDAHAAAGKPSGGDFNISLAKFMGAPANYDGVDAFVFKQIDLEDPGATNYSVYSAGGLNILAGSLRIGSAVAPTGALDVDGTLKLQEQADAIADTAAYGQFWVHDDAPCTPWFTDDAGNDTQLGMISYDADLITNGGFDTDTDWIKGGAEWTIAGGVAHFESAAGSQNLTQQNIGTGIGGGEVYRVEFTLSNTSWGTGTGYLKVKLGGSTSQRLITPGDDTYVLCMAAGASANAQIEFEPQATGDAASLDLDNVSVRRVILV